MAVTPDTTSQTLFRLDQCPWCDYSLQGLPSTGTCPECGQPYDQAHIVLRGWGYGSHATMLNARGIQAWALGFTWISLGPQLFLSMGWLALSVVGAMALNLIVLLAWRRDRRSPGISQVWLGDNGCLQTNEPAAPSLWRDVYVLTSWISIVVCIAAWAMVGHDPLPIIIAALLASQALATWWKRRRSQQNLFFPWARVGRILLEPDDRDLYHLRLRRKVRWYQLAVDAVDAQVQCTPAQAEELRQRIDRWIAGAKEP